MLGRKGIKKGISVYINTKSKDNTNKADPNAIALVMELDSLLLMLSTAGLYLEQKLTEDKLNFNKAITLLYSFGLIVFMLNKEWDKGFAKLALTCVALEVPSTNKKD
ncbi:hypothetical protein LAWI1_G005246 [Lachnellula willkommii]|uniref:Uncharacterized protein n=1 Tax=Lachnellula willkommii TaxID=215461 RepID=A0A559MB58_9HELO|nr:hypothetical protein LAWI1_G005246 [Lachnellula willkommii]